MAERAIAPALIPHRGTARMVETILEASADGVVCRGRVPAGSPFAVDGRVPALVLLELAAQAAAVQQALGAEGGGMGHGYLVAIRSAVLHADEVAAGVSLEAAVRRRGEAGPLASYEVAVTGPEGETILTAMLSTHRGG